ncbi:helix-turn-helix domain-containing protein [Moorena producens JHB]|uniref:Helix-turn-helix domain-containing protein n=1 Tax=Moorena producens (strain JHB) TaxID=1454205 RepID=A0A9Q9SUK3_MOOP1|nr:helix-turn-helix domain-containing protein [Moorena producens]WAN69928.1 helix-turn-helix domain-containing protein [Moorena producens JHB]
MLTLTYEDKLIPSQKQIAVIEDILAVCIKVWNYALMERKDWYKSRKCAVNYCSLQHEYIIPEVKLLRLLRFENFVMS